MVHGVLDPQTFLYAQPVVGILVDPKEVAADCLLSGTEHVVGPTTRDGASADLLYTFADCEHTGTGYSLNPAGEVTLSGSRRSTGYRALAVTQQARDGEAGVTTGEWGTRPVSF